MRCNWLKQSRLMAINLSNGLPYYHGVVMYPSLILASPLNQLNKSVALIVSMIQLSFV